MKKGAKLCDRARAVRVCEHAGGSGAASAAERAGASDASAKGSE